MIFGGVCQAVRRGFCHAPKGAQISTHLLRLANLAFSALECKCAPKTYDDYVQLLAVRVFSNDLISILRYAVGVTNYDKRG